MLQSTWSESGLFPVVQDERAPITHKRDSTLSFSRRGVGICLGDSLSLYPHWSTPTVIISDGPYGVGGFPGDPPTPDGLAEWYEPHIKSWSRFATPATTLWFWNTEVGWATVHPILKKHGWDYRCCNIWDKGIAHIAGNSNSKTLRKFPVVTEVCAQYTLRAAFPTPIGLLPMKEWLRYEWERSGLPLYKTNEACGVKNAATRKYFTKCHLWYYPPPDAFDKLSRYANKYGERNGKPFFSLDGKSPISKEFWSRMRAKFNCPNGVTNVWDHPAVRGGERLKTKNRCVHMNQKPLKLIEQAIEASSDKGDVVWEPFGGLCSAAIASFRLGRNCHAAELNEEYYHIAASRLENM